MKDGQVLRESFQGEAAKRVFVASGVEEVGDDEREEHVHPRRPYKSAEVSGFIMCRILRNWRFG